MLVSTRESESNESQLVKCGECSQMSEARDMWQCCCCKKRLHIRCTGTCVQYNYHPHLLKYTIGILATTYTSHSSTPVLCGECQIKLRVTRTQVSSLHLLEMKMYNKAYQEGFAVVKDGTNQNSLFSVVYNWLELTVQVR